MAKNISAAHSVIAGASSSLSAPAKYAGGLAKISRALISAMRMPTISMDIGVVVYARYLGKTCNSATSSNMKKLISGTKKRSSAMTLATIVGLRMTFLKDISFLSPVMKYTPSVQLNTQNTMLNTIT